MFEGAQEGGVGFEVEDAGGVGEGDGWGWKFESGGGFEDGVDVIWELVGAFGHAPLEQAEVVLVALVGVELSPRFQFGLEVFPYALSEFDVAFGFCARGEGVRDVGLADAEFGGEFGHGDTELAYLGAEFVCALVACVVDGSAACPSQIALAHSCWAILYLAGWVRVKGLDRGVCESGRFWAVLGVRFALLDEVVAKDGE